MYKDLYLEKFLLLIKSGKEDEVESVYYLFIIERKHYLNFIVTFLVVVLLLLFFSNIAHFRNWQELIDRIRLS